MTREQIEKAALLCAGAGEYGECPYNPDAKKGFIAGADWRINSVWHDGSIRPGTDKGDLLVTVQDVFGKDVHFRQDAYYVLKYGCKRWAYIKDLIPNTEE